MSNTTLFKWHKGRPIKKAQPKTALKVAKKALKVARSVKNDEDIKYSYSYLPAASAVPVMGAGGFSFLTGVNITRGANALNNIIGEWYVAKELEVDLEITCSAPCFYRVTIVQDKENYTGAQIANDAMIYDYAVGGASTFASSPLAYENFINKKRFRVLYDKCFAATNIAESEVKVLRIKKKLNSKIHWFNGGMAQAEGAITVLCRSSVAATVTHQGFSRLLYVDA